MPLLGKNDSAVFDYDFMMSLNEKDYKKYLCLAYLKKTGQKLNLKNPKTINEKIQWLKVYDNKPIKATLTDKILVREWIKEKIGDTFLKPALWIGDKFDDIPFDLLPESFIIKAGHGCKWQFIIKNKEEFLHNTKLFNSAKLYMDNWLLQSFFGWSDFETQYLNIKPKIIIEPFMLENELSKAEEVEIWCFNGKPKIIQQYQKKFKNDTFIDRDETFYDENFNKIDFNTLKIKNTNHSEIDPVLIELKNLSEKLAKGFKFVRVDWMLYKNKPYFLEMTFTPYSGYLFITKNKYNLQKKLGKMLNLKGD